MTRLHKFNFLLFTFYFSLFTFLPACWRPPGFGMGGRYLDARQEITRRGGDLNKAIVDLEDVVRRDPFYEDSLALLGRAYYKSGRYQDAFQLLKRALAVDPRNEITWIALGLTQLRIGDDENGLKSFKGGITLLSRTARRGEPYRGVDDWDKNGLVLSALRRAVLFAARGPEEKRKIIRAGEVLLGRIDDEQWEGKMEEAQQERSD